MLLKSAKPFDSLSSSKKLENTGGLIVGVNLGLTKYVERCDIYLFRPLWIVKTMNETTIWQFSTKIHCVHYDLESLDTVLAGWHCKWG